MPIADLTRPRSRSPKTDLNGNSESVGFRFQCLGFRLFLLFFPDTSLFENWYLRSGILHLGFLAFYWPGWVYGNGWLALRRRKRTFRVRDYAQAAFINRLIHKVLVPLVRLWFRTCRVTMLNERIYHEYFLSDMPIVGAT